MKLFGRTGGHWLFWVTVGYVITFTINWYSVPCIGLEYIQMAYIAVVSLPLWFNPLADHFNIKTLRELL